MTRSRITAAIVAALALTGCGGQAVTTSSQPAASPAAAPSPSPAPAATPDTAAAARQAAQNIFALFSAGQYAAVYPLIDAQARAVIPERKFMAVHEECPPQAAGLAYKIGKPVMAGQTAVMAVSLAGVASSLGSEEESFVYQDGAWMWAPSASDLASYRGTVAHVVAAWKAAGDCG
jgi:hypothetical protein